jgi:hyaluronate lyase
MHENYYNRREEKIFSSDNWWDWEIGTPENLLEGLVCISEDISQKLIDKYLEPINRYVPLPSMTMSNRINTAYSSIFSGVLQKDYKKIAISVENFRECFETVEKLDGFYDDGSFIQHNYISYLGEYGVEMMTALTIISYSLDESIFRLDEYMKKNQFNWIVNSFLPSMYKGGIMDLVRGRSIVRDIRGDQSGKMITNAMCLMIDYLENEEDINYLKPILKNFYELNHRYLMYSATPSALIKLEEFENDEDIKAKKIDDFSKIFSRMDKAISQVNNVAIGISMSSSRSGKYESINGENRKGWYTGDGMTYIYLNVNDYGSNYWKNINNYRLQGTTVTKAKREEKIYLE